MFVTTLLMFIFYKRDEIADDFCFKRGILKISIVHSFIHKTIGYFV